MISQKEDIALMNSGGYGAFGGGGNLLWWILIVIFVFLFVFRGRDGEHHRGYGYGDGYGCGHIKGQRPVFYDESNYEEERNLNKEICKEGSKTRALIELNHRDASLKEFIKNESLLASKDGKISQLEQTLLMQRDYGHLQAHLNRIECEIKALPKASPCFIPTRTIPTCEPCTVPSRHDFGGCGC